MLFFNASGCWAATEEQINLLLQCGLDSVITKTCTLYPRSGNPEPTFFRQDTISINSKGIPSDGYEYYKQICIQHKHNRPILSVLWETDENNTIALLNDYNTQFLENEYATVELNLSCPNLQKEIPAYNPTLLDHILTTIHRLKLNSLQFSLKLSPYLDHTLCNQIIDVINKHATTCNHIQYIVLANSIPNCILFDRGNYVLSTVYGGLSGKYNKPISLSNVHYFRPRLHSSIEIIGCGGIDCVEDVDDYRKCGAFAVQLGSCFYKEDINQLDYDKIRGFISAYKKEQEQDSAK